ILEQQSPPLFDGPYLLEVQSPGIERQLKTEREIRIFSGNRVEIKSKEVIPELGDTFTGMLKGIDDGIVHIKKPQAVIRSKKAKPHAVHKQPPDEIELELTKLFS